MDCSAMQTFPRAAVTSGRLRIGCGLVYTIAASIEKWRKETT